MENKKIRFKVVVVAEADASYALEGNKEFDRVISTHLGEANSIEEFGGMVVQIDGIIDKDDKFYNYEREEFVASIARSDFKRIATNGPATDIRETDKDLAQVVLDLEK